MKSYVLVLIIFISLCPISAIGQNAVPPQPSPNAIATVKHENTYIKVTYSRPHKRGRTVFGGMIPYDKVWRTGANEASEITITKDVRFASKALKAGTYTLFTIPREDQWTIIFNTELGQWGAYEYDESKDILRVEVPSANSTVAYEPFTIEFEQTAKMTHLVLRWDTTVVSIPIHFI